eukprot:6121067-Amphidinium_carterae.2
MREDTPRRPDWHWHGRSLDLDASCRLNFLWHFHSTMLQLLLLPDRCVWGVVVFVLSSIL